MRQLSLDAVLKLQVKAVQYGGRVEWTDNGAGEVLPTKTVHWDVSGSCEDPQPVEIYGRQSQRLEALTKRNSARYRPQVVGFARLLMQVECRKCSRCLAKRAARWEWRAKQEFAACERTWHGTLTFPAHHHFMVDTKLRVALHKQGTDFEALSEPEKFALRVSGYRAKEKWGTAALGADLTKYLKRVRKQTEAPMRYLCVAEPHPGGGENDGYPHFHILVHEVDFAAPIRKAVLRDQWEHFSRWKLTNTEAQATYLCKYLTEEMAARVRASIDYGNPPSSTNNSLESKAYVKFIDSIFSLSGGKSVKI